MYVDRVSANLGASMALRTEAFQLFLKMDQLLQDSEYPPNRMLRARQTYKFPFTFVVPEALPNTCKHKTASDRVKSDHLRLPPSLGDAEISGIGSTLMDDLAPDMTRITYGVRVRLQKLRAGDEKEIILSDKTRKIRVVPAIEEQPPVTVEDSEEYCLRREKSIRKGLLKAKSGKLVMKAHQPKSLHLPAPESEDSEGSNSATTMASVQLRFDPTGENVEPPKLGQISSKLRVGTFFASCARQNFPSQKTMRWDATQGLYVDVINLSARCISGTEWLRHEPHTPSTMADLRRGSGLSISGQAFCPEPSDIYKPELPFYTAELLIPVSPPKTKLLVPTFHSCLVSRVYNLEMSLSLPPTSSISLKVPLQVSAQAGSGIPAESAGSSVGFLESDLSEDDFLHDRRPSAPPYSAHSGTGRHLMMGNADTQTPPPPPPDYSFLAPRTGGITPGNNASAMHHSLPLVR